MGGLTPLQQLQAKVFILSHIDLWFQGCCHTASLLRVAHFSLPAADSWNSGAQTGKLRPATNRRRHQLAVLHAVGVSSVDKVAAGGLRPPPPVPLVVGFGRPGAAGAGGHDGAANENSVHTAGSVFLSESFPPPLKLVPCLVLGALCLCVEPPPPPPPGVVSRHRSGSGCCAVWTPFTTGASGWEMSLPSSNPPVGPVPWGHSITLLGPSPPMEGRRNGVHWLGWRSSSSSFFSTTGTMPLLQQARSLPIMITTSQNGGEGGGEGEGGGGGRRS